ncbi:putative ABC transport system ATP-binding protein [Negativicoccus succinicivorans]|uniref:Putative ABC transport system ATP-binding protein n=1 Tax=Negativicoccus succinicivorans TaxID=620903 RepID=A0A841R0A4_9FIRM|nr:ABC transporter ATP-binding protein [Negativicoccus succinicivorans]KGF10969.1 hypothetical protein HMPREF1633_07650 [Tissierellia bacterium S5-A11]MBB6477345.1 putative ABC transport system ATP-binding protein [Negativicoccus succinicivorans]MDU2095338.1 ABC transporter ATP-binding protein [Negativicoccus succinicivorans]MDU2183821.1 ABC transporter ATP-binding protein [Negativicoccus succinicivorans]MDU4558626.1 ABC transporter ATP-binding protein [Negativicoccus succinicivorans]
MITLRNVKKSYRDGDHERTVLAIEALELGDCSQWALVGPSGSGKSTLLHLLAGLTRAQEGVIQIDGTDLTACRESQLDEFRAAHVGYVMQNFSLLPTLRARDNILAGAFFARTSDRDRADAAEELLRSVGLPERGHQLPRELSMGEQQRVAVARALIKNPDYIFADEPTASLDRATGMAVIELLQQRARAASATLIVATHDKDVAAKLDGTIRLEGGRLCCAK